MIFDHFKRKIRPSQKLLNDRAFVLGLDELFREAMKTLEVTELLPIVRFLLKAVDAIPATDAVEGYYAESDNLCEYFRSLRALQRLNIDLVPATAMPQREVLWNILSSRAFGRIDNQATIAPRLASPLNETLNLMPDWTIATIIEKATKSLRADDVCLISVAICTQDPVAICAVRETLAANILLGAELEAPPIWAVNPIVADLAARFIATLGADTGIVLPEPLPSNVGVFWAASKAAKVDGRCVAMAQREFGERPFYHWRIKGELDVATVDDFWDDHIVTTQENRTLHSTD